MLNLFFMLGLPRYFLFCRLLGEGGLESGATRPSFCPKQLFFFLGPFYFRKKNERNEKYIERVFYYLKISSSFEWAWSVG